MSIPITCSCGQALSATDDTAGGTFYCWSCGRPVPVPGTAKSGGFSSTAPTSRPRTDDSPALTRRFTFPSGDWERVRSGLMTCNIAAGCFLVLTLVGWFIILQEKPPGGLKALSLFIMLLLAGGTVVGSVGAIACSAVPQEAGSKGPVALAAALLVGGAIGTTILCLIFAGAALGNTSPSIGQGFFTFLRKLMLLGIQGGFLMFMFFQLITALHLGERGIASSVIGFQLAPVVFAAISPLGHILTPLTGAFEGGTVSDAKLWLNLTMVMISVMILWFITINGNLRASIEAADRRQHA